MCCRFHWTEKAWRVWLITCGVEKALPPNFTHRAMAQLFVHGELVGREEWYANDLDSAVLGLLEKLHGRVPEQRR